MATYQKDFYKAAKYGRNVPNGISIEPFTAKANDYNKLYVSFKIPTGSSNWQRGRMLRSKTGWASDQNDGVVVWDAAPNHWNTSFVDEHLDSGRYYYYTLWIQDKTGRWMMAGQTSGLSIGNSGMAAILWDRIPKFYRWIRADNAAITDTYSIATSVNVFNPEMFDAENSTLRRFVEVLGWGEELVRSYSRTLGYLNDPRKVHLSDLQRLAGQMGVEYDPEIPGSVMRAKVENAGLLARERGTLKGLKDLAQLSTGWGVDLQISPNMVLSRESSEFVNPQFPLWDSFTNYPVNMIVVYQGSLWKAVQAAYGPNQPPPQSPATGNTWWTQITVSNVSSLFNPSATVAGSGTLGSAATANYYSWVRTWSSMAVKSVYNGSNGLGINPFIQLSSGVSGALDPANQVYNALQVQNTLSVAANVTAVGTGGTPTASAPSSPTGGVPIVSQANAIGQGIPIPIVLDYAPTHTYYPGDLTRDNGRLWRSRGTISNLRPSQTPWAWDPVGFDERPWMTYSFYTHSDVTGSSNTGYGCVPGVSFYDQYGKWISAPGGPEDVFYDTFNQGAILFGNGADHVPDLGFISAQAPTWNLDSGSFQFWTGTPDWTSVFPSQIAHGTTNLMSTNWAVSDVMSSNQTYNVAVQFVEDTGATGMKDGLAVHITDLNNFYLFARDGIYQMSGGTLSARLFTYPNPVKNFDRMRINLDKTSGSAWTLYVNEIQVTTGSASGITMTVPSGRVHHGLAGVPA